MDACTLDQLESYSDQLAATVKGLTTRFRNQDSPDASPETEKDIVKAKAAIIASVEGIKTLLDGPADFLQRLTAQVELLACLHWFAEFQIMACIPPEVSLPIGDLAELTGVPESQLRRVIRLTASCGVLQEPKPGFVSHTTISAQFLANPSLFDAAVFMAESAAPSALQMASATRNGGTRTAYDLALNTARPFHAACQERSKLGRQWKAYLAHAAGLHSEAALVDTFSRLNWSSLENACIVEVGAQSTSMARSLAKTFTNLHLFVQINHTGTLVRDSDMDVQSDSEFNANGGRITVAYRETGMPQPITDAAVYMLHLPPAGEMARAELYRHLGLLRASGGIMLVLTTRLLPEPGSLPDPQIEAVARARDLSMLQLANEGEMEMSDLLQIVESVVDDIGKLIVANELRSHNGLILALALKHLYHGF